MWPPRRHSVHRQSSFREIPIDRRVLDPTSVYDLAGNMALADLETFQVTRNGQPFKRPDFNFWGVTFAPDGDTFYATLGTGGTINFMKGSVSAPQMTLIGSDVECPSLSPDGRRVAYKARVVEGGRVIWRIRVRDLASGATATSSEMRGVDDQVEWLNDREILYALPHSTTGSGSSDVWVVAADGSGQPRVFVPNAFSPAVIRAGSARPYPAHVRARAAGRPGDRPAGPRPRRMMSTCARGTPPHPRWRAG